MESSSDAAIARVLEEEEEAAYVRRRIAELEGRERREKEENEQLRRRAEAWWDGKEEDENDDDDGDGDGDGGGVGELRNGVTSTLGAAVRSACSSVLEGSYEIARRVSDAGIKGVIAVTPRQRLPYAILHQSDEHAGTHTSTSSSEYVSVRHESTDARRRLSALLKTYGLAEVCVRGDGNCQYRALAHQIYGIEHEHAAVRERVVQQLAQDPLRYRPFVVDVVSGAHHDEDGIEHRRRESAQDTCDGGGDDDGECGPDYTTYVAQVATEGTWGDHVTLQAAADAYGLNVSLLTSFESEPLIEILPRERKSTRTVWLSFWAEVHYNAIRVV